MYDKLYFGITAVLPQILHMQLSAHAKHLHIQMHYIHTNIVHAALCVQLLLMLRPACGVT